MVSAGSLHFFKRIIVVFTQMNVTISALIKSILFFWTGKHTNKSSKSNPASGVQSEGEQRRSVSDILWSFLTFMNTI